jgi:hypothetical protein
MFFNIYLMLFTCTALHIKSKGLSIDVSHWLSSNTFCPCRVNRSRLMYHRTFHTQQSSTYGKQVTSIYLYPSGIQWDQLKFYKLIIIHYSIDKNYKVPGLLLSSDSVRMEKSYKDTNSWATSDALLPNASRSASSMVKWNSQTANRIRVCK